MWYWLCAGIPLVVFSFVALAAIWLFGPAWFVVPFLNQGRYAQAARRMRWLRWTMGASLAEGAVLFHADRLDEAEKVLRASIARGGGGNATLVYVLMAQGKYAELYQNALAAGEAHEEFGLVRAMGELFAGRATEATLARIDRLARSGFGEDSVSLAITPGAVAELHATRAWALAELGRSDEVPAAIERAMTALPSASPGNAGQAWWLLAHAARAGSNPEAEKMALESAMKADPGGVYARLALEALADGLRATRPSGP